MGFCHQTWIMGFCRQTWLVFIIFPILPFSIHFCKIIFWIPIFISCTPLTEEMLMRNTSTGQQLSGIKFGIFDYVFAYNSMKKPKKTKKNIGRHEMLTKKPIKWKKHSVSIFVLGTTFGKTYPHLIWDFPQVTSVEKKETSKTFLSLGLRPRLQKLFSRYPFFYFG